ncbi:hypothetical protein PsorP6_005082 [Peronosclerospora sorghi]|uniref:Uncharacterized protein n=1 Tax=Peronosclerospora sorghi TaxID=230839 RepID=A0ACC0W5N6_9STRA|nr:hypothetical protein PsorP6_005082 [Peronosclerospora sorghi]
MTDKRNVPIDIHYKQLLGSLVDRCIVPNKWQDLHKQVRDAIAALYQELPLTSVQLAQFHAKKSNHEDLTYFDCKFIVQCLEQSEEGKAKNFLGQYTSPVLKRWQALIRQYEKNNIFAAETARLIAQNTAYEIPFLRKSIQQNEKHVAENNRKIADLTKHIAEYERKLKASCAAMGIAGQNFRQELRQSPLALPSLFDEVARAICCDEMAGAIAYHEALQTYLRNCDIPAVTPSTESISLEKVKKTKQSSTKQTQEMKKQEMTTDKAPQLSSAPHKFLDALHELREASDKVTEVKTAFDFEAEAAEMSWDISLNDSGVADIGEIDWNIEMVASVEPAALDDDTPVEIDWDIMEPVRLLNDAQAVDLNESEPKTPVVSEAITRVELLENSDFRARALNDLLELQAFLRQRLVELGESDSVAFANQFQSSSGKNCTLHPLVNLTDDEMSSAKLEEFQAAVSEALSRLTSKRLHQLILMKESERYVDRHVASLEMLTQHIDKCHREIHSLEDKNIDLIDATKTVQPQIKTLVTMTKRLKQELEAVLPRLFKGYKVNIIGEVNTL